MNYFSIETVTLWVNSISTITQIFLITIAYRALEQVKQQKKQNELTRETVAINELRHFEKFILDYQNLTDLIDEKNTTKIPLGFLEMNDFNLSESFSSIFKDSINNWHIFYEQNKDVFTVAVNCANKLEVISTALEYGTAKIETIEDSIALTFCTFVEYNFYIYIRHRNDALNLYSNTIKIYKKLKPKVKTVKEQVEKIQAEIKKNSTPKPDIINS